MRVVPREDKGAAREKKAGFFVLLTNVPEDALDARGILQNYKGQYADEQNFAFLKDPLIVNDLFLKTPSRIDALGMILTGDRQQASRLEEEPGQRSSGDVHVDKGTARHTCVQDPGAAGFSATNR